MKKNLFFASAGTLLTAVILLSAISALAQQKKKAETSMGPKGAVREPYQLVIDFGSPGDEARLRDWSGPMNEKELYNLGKPHGLVVQADRGPVSDGKARLITQYGSHAVIGGLSRNSHYWIWVDVVTYRNSRGADFPINLDIFVDRRLVRTVSFAAMTGEMDALMIELPYDLTQDGEVDVLFRERSHYFGIWGVWDVIVRDGPYLPAKIEAPVVNTVKKDMGVKERIIEERPKVKKLEKKSAKKEGISKPDKKKDETGAGDEKPGARGDPEKMKSGKPVKGVEKKIIPEKKIKKQKPAGKKAAPENKKLKPGEEAPVEKKDDIREPGRERKMDEPGKTVDPYIPRDPAVPGIPDIKNEHDVEKDGKK